MLLQMCNDHKLQRFIVYHYTLYIEKLPETVQLQPLSSRKRFHLQKKKAVKIRRKIIKTFLKFWHKKRKKWTDTNMENSNVQNTKIKKKKQKDE